jgi:hypothetical protein
MYEQYLLFCSKLRLKHEMKNRCTRDYLKFKFFTYINKEI